MNKYLITWYGITDFKAALGIEKKGPVLAALLAGDYSRVRILAYTKPEQADGGQKSDERQELVNRLQLSRLEMSSLSSDEVMNYVDLLANTPEGHGYFSCWLKERLTGHIQVPEIDLRNIYIPELNDFTGIYSAATNALKEIEEEEGKNDYEVTLYLSPGTPVMAFSWAFLAIANRDKNIKVIASPDYRKEPQRIIIPGELAESGMKLPDKEKHEDFDVIFHLMGEQTQPIALGILQFNCREHIFVTSEGYSPTRFDGVLPSDCKPCRTIVINPFDPKEVRSRILNFIRKNNNWKKIGFNLTGGTKLMFAGALSACHSVQGSPFYFETGTQSLLWLNTFEKKKISSLKNIETFFTLNENVIIKNNGRWENDPEREKRIALTQKIWNNRNSIASIYRFLEAFNDTPGVPFEISNKYVKARLYEDKKAEITIGGEKFTRKDWPDFAKYLSGGWFEEFTYLQLRPLLDKGVITDLRIGFEVVWKNDPESLAQELDVVAANGNQMMIIECKAGGLKSEYIHKLQNNIANYGGVNGLGALVCASQRLPGHVKSRIEAQSHIGLFMNEAVVKTLPRQVFNLTGSGIYLT